VSETTEGSNTTWKGKVPEVGDFMPVTVGILDLTYDATDNSDPMVTSSRLLFILAGEINSQLRHFLKSRTSKISSHVGSRTLKRSDVSKTNAGVIATMGHSGIYDEA